MAVWNKNPYIRDRFNLIRVSIVLFALYLSFILATQLLGQLFAILTIAILSYLIGHYVATKRYRKRGIQKISKKKLLLVRAKTALSYTPTVVWGGFAVFGILLLGMLLAFAYMDTPQELSAQETKKELQFREIIDGYQDVSRLFYLQQQDMDIVTNSSSWLDNPEELSDAIYSYKQKKNEIIFQWGRIYELRRKAGLSEDTYFKPL